MVKEPYPPGHGPDPEDAELDLVLAAAEDHLLTAIQHSLDLDAGLARIIGNPPRRETAFAISASAATYELEGFQAIPTPAEMAIDTLAEYTEAEPDADDPVLAQQACAVLERWLQDHPQVAGEIRETARAHIHLQELQRCTREAQDAQRNAGHDATMLARLDPGGHRVLGFVPGAVLIALLAVLDAIPLNWAAQALGLGSGATWMVTFILAIASVAAMLGFELTRGHPRRRWRLSAVVTAGFVALLALRTEYLTAVAGESLPAALLQAGMLTAVSAGLTVCGSVVLARTRSLSLSRACSAARRARQATTKAYAAQRLASEKLQQQIAVLRQMFLPWALGSAAPVGVNHAEWAVALERAVRQILLAAPVGVDRAKWAVALERAVRQILAS